MECLADQLILAQLCAASRLKIDELIILKEIDSTNDYLLRMADKARVIACFTERQSAGKGQRGKSWCSPEGQIYFSLMWQFAKSPFAIMGLGLAVAVATVRALLHCGLEQSGKRLGLKWPNDIYVDGKKLAGILVESLTLSPELQNTVIGIGLNIAATLDHAENINQPWICVEQILGKKVDRNRFAGVLLNELLQALEQFNRDALNSFQNEWQLRDCLRGKRITVSHSETSLTGIANGISPRGELLLTDDQQRQHICLTGSVRLA